MMTKYLATAAFLAMLFCAVTAQQCTVSIDSVRQATWVDGGVQPRSLWTITIRAPVDVSNVLVNIDGPLQQIWEMVQVDNTNVYRLPDWRIQIGGIQAGQSHVFGFIINNNNTQSPVTLNSVICPGSPSPSASASPAASASASPSASPAPTIVNTPIPSPTVSASPSSSPVVSTSPGLCAATLTQVARGASQGGSWTQGGFVFQIYDLTLTNVGSQPLRNVTFVVNFASDQDIPADQFWNLVRLSTNTFSVAPMVLPNPGATATSIGYVLRTPVGSSSGSSSIGTVTVAC